MHPPPSDSETNDLAQLQKTLARALIDPAFRKSLVTQPTTHRPLVETSDRSTPQPLTAASLNPLQIADFAALLSRKRQGEALQLLPWTVATLSNHTAPHFSQFSHRHPPHGLNKPLEDAIAFQRWLLQPNTATPALSPWQLDVIRFEQAAVLVSSRRNSWLVRRFRFRVDTWTPEAHPTPSAPPQPGCRVCIWWRSPHGSELYFRALRLPKT